MRRNHMFKKRYSLRKELLPAPCSGNFTIYSPYKQAFNLVYIRLIKKLLRRKFIKAQVNFFKPKYWFYLKLNFILASKSKNARMGAGVGAYVRLVSVLHPFYKLIEFKKYSVKFIKKVINFVEFKCGIKFMLK